MFHPDPAHLLHDPRSIQPPIIVLPACHRHGIIKQNFIGHGRASGERRANGLDARVIIGAIAYVLEHMRAGGEQRLANPIGPLTAHLREPQGLPIHPLHHVMTANARIGAAALGNFRGAAVGAARAEIRHAAGQCGRIVCGLRRINSLQRACKPCRSAALSHQNLTEFLRNHHWIERIAIGKEQCALGIFGPKNPPAAFLIEKSFFDLSLNQFAFLFDNNDAVQTFRPFGKRLHIKWPSHGDFVGCHAMAHRRPLIHAEHLHGMGQIQPIFARRDKANFCASLSQNALIHPIGACKGLHGSALVINDPRLLGLRRVDEADIQAPFGHVELWGDKVQPQRIAVHHRGHFYRVFDAFQPGPNPSKARQGKAEEPVIHNLLDAGRRQHRHEAVDHRPFRLVQCGRALAGVIIPKRRHNTAQGRGAGHIRMTKDIAGAIHARPFAIPKPKHALKFSLTAQLGLLAAPKRRCGQILIQPFLKPHLRIFKLCRRAGHLKIHRAQWRSAIARDIASCPMARRSVARRLHQHHPH